MVRAYIRNCAFVRSGSIDVGQSKLRGWHLGYDVGLTRQLTVQSCVIAFDSEGK